MFALLIGAGCSGGGTVGYYGSATATVAAPFPDMVYVSPGVQVIADYDEPVFYTDGYYWRYYDSTWYRSHTWTGGWVYASPPRPLLRIDRPHRYVRYRPQGYVARRPARTYRDDRYRDNRPIYRDQGPVIRDQRDPRYRVEPQRQQPRPTPTPDARDRDRGRDRDDRDRARDKDRDKDRDDDRRDRRTRDRDRDIDVPFFRKRD